MPNIRKNYLIKRVLIFIKSWKWQRYFVSNSGIFTTGAEINSAKANLRKDAHTIEKGLSLPEVRAYFGADKLKQLLDDIDRLRSVRVLEEEIEAVVSVIQSYLDWHMSRNFVDQHIKEVERRIAPFLPVVKTGGTIRFTNNFSTDERELYQRMVTSRRSVRNFSEKPVPFAEIEKSITTAWSSPSVCNRQPCAVFVSQDANEIEELLKLKSSNRGFEKSVQTLLVVLADTRAFVEDYEIFEPYVDAGIFSGALVNALHSYGIGSCCLNLCVSHHIAERIIKELNTPKHMFPIMMIACGYPSEFCEVALSPRGPSVIFESQMCVTS
jgi:nitroreductase